ncbi:hypothetical protein KA107_01380 [Candidatus Pacearchaeota archaeon]|nr:hypothetical protein [Candidatus Pacearchaeota archaeon]
MKENLLVTIARAHAEGKTEELNFLAKEIAPGLEAQVKKSFEQGGVRQLMLDLALKNYEARDILLDYNLINADQADRIRGLNRPKKLEPYDSFLEEGRKLTSKALKKEIRELGQIFFLTGQDIKEIYNISRYVSAISLINKAFSKPVSERLKDYILAELGKGRDIYEIANLTQRSVPYIRTKLVEYGLDLDSIKTQLENKYSISDERITKRVKEMRRLALEGKSLPSIGKEVGVSRQRAKQVIDFLGIHDAWKLAREIDKGNVLSPEALEKRNAVENLLDLLKTRKSKLEEALEPRDREALHAAEKYYSSPHRRFTLEDYYSIFRTYFESKERGDIHFKDLGRKTGKRYNSVSRILRSQGYETENKAPRLPKEKKDILRASPLTAVDIKYLFNCPSPQIFANRNIKRCIARFGRRKTWEFLTYRKASEIYEATDAGFSVQEVKELIGSSETLINYALENRPAIARPISETIRKFCGLDSYEKPYLTTELKSKMVQRCEH